MPARLAGNKDTAEADAGPITTEPFGKVKLPMIKMSFFKTAAFCAGSATCLFTTSTTASTNTGVHRIHNVRTTAYTHTESDHVVYGSKNAAGGSLKYGKVRSAAADWSVYPVGTKFRIEGDPAIYEVDDYGSALVGTETIDIYKPCRSSMNEWGVRKVNIQVIKWGSFATSLAIMKPRAKKATHVEKMVRQIEDSIESGS